MLLILIMKKTYLSVQHLQTMIAIAETGSFTLAAARLGVTQPGISHGIRELETSLGVRLFERRRGEGASLTNAGSRALIEARAALVHIERLEQAARTEATLVSGRLRLACFPSAAKTFIPAVLAKYHRLYPGVRLDIREDAGETVDRAIYAREVDLGMVTLPGASDLVTFPAYEDELMVVLHKDDQMPTAKGRISPRKLATKPFLMSQDATENLVRFAFATAGVEPNVILTAQDAQMLLEFVRQGLGITVLPSNLLEPGRLRGLKAMALHPRVSRRVAFAAVSLESLTPAVGAFLKLLETQSTV
jgi:DNA-binding transcriptional LysR family regulator